MSPSGKASDSESDIGGSIPSIPAKYKNQKTLENFLEFFIWYIIILQDLQILFYPHQALIQLYIFLQLLDVVMPSSRIYLFLLHMESRLLLQYFQIFFLLLVLVIAFQDRSSKNYRQREVKNLSIILTSQILATNAKNPY